MSVDMEDLEDGIISPQPDDSMVLDESMEVRETDMSDLSESTDEISLDEEDIGGMPSLMDDSESETELNMDADLLMSDLDDSSEEVINLEDGNLDDIDDLSMDDQMLLDDISEDEVMDDQSDLMSLEIDEGFPSNENSLIQTEALNQTKPEPKLVGNELLLRLPHELTVEIGKASLKGEDITTLNYGSIIELDKQVGDPVDIVLGNKTIAKGEVVQINQNKLGIRVTRIDF